MQRKFLKNTGPTLPGFEMCEMSEHIISHPLISSQEASLANRIALQENALQVQMNETSGESSTVSFAILGPNMSWLKTYQEYLAQSLDGFLEEYLETWPKAGMMRNGTAYALPTLEHHTDENDSSLLPTPSAQDGPGFYVVTYVQSEKRIRSGKHQLHWVQFGTVFHRLSKGWANPAFGEAMMGLPIGWTGLGASETQ